MSTLNIVFLIFTSNARRSYFDSPYRNPYKTVYKLNAMVIFLCFVAKIQFGKPVVLLQQLDIFAAVKYLQNRYHSLISDIE